MKANVGRLVVAGLVSSVLVVAATSRAGAGSKREPLNRSIYVPITLNVCEHLNNAVLYVEDEPVAQVPTRRIFQFTYYPALKRVVPEHTQIRIEGVDGLGQTFVARLAISPRAIMTANERIDLDFEHLIKKFTHKIDIRFEPILLRVRCGSTCPIHSSTDEEKTTNPLAATEAGEPIPKNPEAEKHSHR